VLGEDVPPLGAVLALGILNANWRTGSLWGDVGGIWSKLADIDLAFGQASLHWLRYGNRVVVDTGAATAAADYFPANILEGSHFEMDTGGDPVIRRITTNSEGAWNNATTKRPVLDLEGVLGSDPASGTTGRIWSKDAVLFVHDATRYRRYKLKIDAQPTAEGVLRCGLAVLGHAFIMGRQYSAGRIRETQPNTEITTHRSGTRTSRELGTPRRTAEFAWSQIVPAGQIFKTNPTPDYVLGAVGGQPAASTRDTLHSLAGWIEHLRGAHTPVIYCDSVPLAANTGVVTTIVNRARFLYSRITSVFRIENVLGNESETEANNATGVTLEEEL
jgi:hypothetical protein